MNNFSKNWIYDQNQLANICKKAYGIHRLIVFTTINRQKVGLPLSEYIVFVQQLSCGAMATIGDVNYITRTCCIGVCFSNIYEN